MSDDQRIAQGHKILADLHLFKVCVGCGSIVTMPARACPLCNAYSFNEDSEFLRAHVCALLLEKPRTVKPEDMT